MKDWMGRRRPKPGRPAHLTETIVCELRYRKNRTDVELADELRLPVHVIYDARRGRTWKHIKDPAPLTNDDLGAPVPEAKEIPVGGFKREE